MTAVEIFFAVSTGQVILLGGAWRVAWRLKAYLSRIEAELKRNTVATKQNTAKLDNHIEQHVKEGIAAERRRRGR